MRAVASCALFGWEEPTGPPGAALVEVADALQTHGCSHIVLDAAVDGDVLSEWRDTLQAQSPGVVAVHAPCPMPRTSAGHGRFHPGDICLATLDATDRSDALAFIRPALDCAAEVGAPGVIIEGGPLRDLARVGDSAPGPSADSNRGLQEAHGGSLAFEARARGGRAGVEGLSFVVDALLRAVESRGLTLTIAEQRAWDWFGSYDEIQSVLERFSGGPVGWWADPGGRMAAGRSDEWTVRPAGGECGPAGVWWRVPETRGEGHGPGADVIHGGICAESDPDIAVVLTHGDGRLAPWHWEIWDTLPA